MASANVFSSKVWLYNLNLGSTRLLNCTTPFNSSMLVGTRSCIACKWGWFPQIEVDLSSRLLLGVGMMTKSCRNIGRHPGVRVLNSSAAVHALWVSTKELKLNGQPWTTNSTATVLATYCSCCAVKILFCTAKMSNRANRRRGCKFPFFKDFHLLTG